MKRRDFIKAAGAGAASAVLSNNLLRAGLQTFEYPTPGEINKSEVTFFVVSDTHFDWEVPTIGGHPTGEEVRLSNAAAIDTLNNLPGTAYPAAIGGVVDVPLGALLVGDLTDEGDDPSLKPSELAADHQFSQWMDHYGFDAADGMLRYPVFACTGNHDNGSVNTNEDYGYTGSLTAVRNEIITRYGGLNYSWDWGHVHFACLDEYPNAAGRAWLAQDLAAVGTEKAVVLFFHYNMVGYHSDWWSSQDKNEFKAVIDGYNIIGIFNGHNHFYAHNVWEGYDAWNMGSTWPQNFGPSWYQPYKRTYGVVRVTRDQMAVAIRYWPDANTPLPNSDTHPDPNPGPYWHEDMAFVKSITTV